jgi:putative oxidoreductase
MTRFLQWKGHRVIALAARWYLGIVFLLACVHKILHPGQFALDIATYDILPLSLINLMAVTLPWIELAASLLLLLGYRARGAALTVVGMMAMFLTAIGIALHRGLDISCGCFASQTLAENDPISYLTVLRDLAWLLLAAYVAALDRLPLGLEAWLARRRHRRA